MFIYLYVYVFMQLAFGGDWILRERMVYTYVSFLCIHKCVYLCIRIYVNV
jgi:hypothetical protein